jgi:hypothetical protein
MTSRSLSSVILTVFEDREAGAAISVKEVVEAVKNRLDARDRLPGDNEIRGRLAQLRKEGVLERPERGQYRLVRAEPNETEALIELVNLISNRVRPNELRRTVIWDATPFLSVSEDGIRGTRLVVEHDQAGALEDEVGVEWSGDRVAASWITKRSGPLGPRQWGPKESPSYRMDVGIVFAEREKLGGTGLTENGYRTPFDERVVTEFLGEDGPPEAAPIVRNLLNQSDLDFDRLWAASETMGVTLDTGALLAGMGEELSPDLRSQLVEKLSPTLKPLLWGAR